VERLTNSLMMHGRNNGKKQLAVRIVRHALEIVHLLSDQNPVQVVVDAIINAGPREDATRIGSAGVVRRQAVDISPLRRVNQAIFLITTGAREAAFRNVKTIAECLADELINAAKGSSNSYAIKKKARADATRRARAPGIGSGCTLCVRGRALGLGSRADASLPLLPLALRRTRLSAWPRLTGRALLCLLARRRGGSVRPRRVGAPAARAPVVSRWGCACVCVIAHASRSQRKFSTPDVPPAPLHRLVAR
jgi:small subunit ribosomal protein S5e